MRHAEKAARKPRTVVDIEIDKASHGLRQYARIRRKATAKREDRGVRNSAICGSGAQRRKPQGKGGAAWTDGSKF
ncbi:hypothetical protein FALB51S_01133 [Frigidibacter albus]|uniref:Uncharacterized protein n=2 Tax=Frigidibacter mobilis TaxID=1335048 RepID=A0A159YYJ5_9RHOB|nr:hypothetical protein AKL17_0135 [Frigidibacter mobilis]